MTDRLHENYQIVTKGQEHRNFYLFELFFIFSETSSVENCVPDMAFAQKVQLIH